MQIKTPDIGVDKANVAEILVKVGDRVEVDDSIVVLESDKATVAQIATCPITGEAHLYHRAYWHEGKMYYRGQVVIDKSVAVA